LASQTHPNITEKFSGIQLYKRYTGQLILMQ